MKYTLITGASGGIGEALAIKLGKKKHNLILVARNAEKLSKLSKHLQETYGVQATYIAADLTKQDAPFQIFQETQKQNWEIEMLVNNAGIGSGGEFAALNLQSELDLIQLNNASLVAMTHLCTMETTTTLHIQSISQLHQLLQLPKPRHPLVSLTRFEDFVPAKVGWQLSIHPDFFATLLWVGRLNHTDISMKQLTGNTTQHLIHEKLIERAKERLSTTHLSVSEIAYELGFDYPQSFSKLFKTKTRQTPLQFRAGYN